MVAESRNFIWHDEELKWQETADELSYAFDLSTVFIRNKDYLLLFEWEHECLLPCQIDIQQNECLVKHQLSAFHRYLPAFLEDATYVEKILICIQTTTFSQFEDQIIFPILHPNNCYLDRKYQLHTVYRHIDHQTTHYAYSTKECLLERKAFILSLLAKTIDYEQIYEGTFLLNKLPDELKPIMLAETHDAINQHLEILLVEQTHDSKQSTPPLFTKLFQLSGYVLFFLSFFWFLLYYFIMTKGAG